MLFAEKLTELDAVLAPEIDRLFQLALDNSAHENDLLHPFCWCCFTNKQRVIKNKL